MGLVESGTMELAELVSRVAAATVRGDPGTDISGLATTRVTSPTARFSLHPRA
jgi:hypothetical protein